MGFLSFGKNKEKIVAIFDVGSGSVGGAIVKIDTTGKNMPIILKSIRSEIKYREDRNFDLFLIDMIEAFNITLNALYESKIGAPKEIFCTLSSPWYVSENRLIKMAREHSFIFNEHILDELVEKEINNITESYKKKYNNSSEVLEHQVMGISLNGYSVSNPFKKHTKSVEINISISLSLKSCLDKIRESLSKVYPHAEVSFSSFVMNSFIAIRDKYVSPDSYLLIDIGSEITDLGIVSKGILKISLSFPFGNKKLYQIICDQLKIELRDAKELFNLFSKDALASPQKEELMKALKLVESEWGNAFRQCLKVMPNTFSLPETMFLTIDNDTKKWFVDMINNEEYIKSIIVPSKCNIITLDGPSFLNMCNNEGGPCDPFLMIEAIAIMRKIEIRK